MSSTEQDDLYVNTYTTLGAFVVAFSTLLKSLEDATVQLIGGNWMLVKAALADKTASPIVAVYFSVFFKHWEKSLTKEDILVLTQLRKELDNLIKNRNRLLHDAWMTTTTGDNAEPKPFSRHRVRVHGKGVNYESTSTTPEEIFMLIEDVNRLKVVVNASVFNTSLFNPRNNQIGPELDKRIKITNKKISVAND